LVLAALALCTGLQAQVLIGTDGGTSVLPNTTISWSVGEPILGTGSTGSGAMTQGYQQPAGKLIYYSRATGNVSDPIWSRTPTGPAGPANFIPRASMVVQTGHVVTNTATVDLRDVLVQTGGSLQLANGSLFNIHGRNATFLGVVLGSDGSTMALVGNKPVVFTAVSKVNLWDLQMTTPQGTTASGEVDIRGTLQLNEGVLNVSSASFTLRSFAATTGRLGPVPATASYVGNLKVERYIPGGATNWRLLGSPISNRTVQHWQDDFITAGYPGSQFPNFFDPPGSGIFWPSIRWYNEPNTGANANDGMTGVSSSAQPLSPGQGFAVWCGDALGGTAPFVVDLAGAPPVIASSPIALPMSWTDTGNPAADGWNLVSNPVPSAIAFDQIARGADVADYVTFYNPANGNMSVYDIGIGMGTNGATNTIQSSQGFYLKATGPAVGTTVDENDKINDNGGGIFGGLLPDNTPLVRLRFTGSANNYRDEVLIAFSTGTPQQDGEDAIKFLFAHNAAPQVATLTPTGTHLAINAFGAASSAMSIPVSVNAGVNGTYTLSVSTQGDLGVACIGLEDLVTGTLIPIIDGAATYSFPLVGSAPAETRFLLRVLQPSAAFSAADTVEVNTPVTFSNTSVDDISSLWSFGDGTSSTSSSPSHTYSTGGTYLVTLTTTTGTCTSTFTRHVVVTSPALPLSVRVMLQGPYVSSSGLMSDALRSNGLLPLTEPYTARGYSFVGGGGESTSPPVLATTGNNAIVDWVVVELRKANDATIIMASQSALVQRDGDVVATDGISPILFSRPPGSYHIAVLHRNHLGVMTLAPLLMGTAPTLLDLSLPATPTFGLEARLIVNNTALCWAGDVNFDGQVKYTGVNNDRDPILQAIGGVVPTSTITSYSPADVNMDGSVKYTGSDNDRDPILLNIGGVVPTNIRVEQLP
jgi:PKD repeat protein